MQPVILPQELTACFQKALCGRPEDVMPHTIPMLPRWRPLSGARDYRFPMPRPCTWASRTPTLHEYHYKGKADVFVHSLVLIIFSLRSFAASEMVSYKFSCVALATALLASPVFGFPSPEGDFATDSYGGGGHVNGNIVKKGSLNTPSASVMSGHVLTSPRPFRDLREGCSRWSGTTGYLR